VTEFSGAYGELAHELFAQWHHHHEVEDVRELDRRQQEQQGAFRITRGRHER
jgi:hypothetical protein